MLVVDAQDGSLLLITKDIIAERPYNDTLIDVTWENCTLRKWLNDDFYNRFSAEEKAMITSTTRETDDNPQYGTKGGNDTYDKIFLLSLVGAESYFSSERERVAKSNGKEEFWWLRSPGETQKDAACIGTWGYVSTKGMPVNMSAIGVRPVLWVTVD